MACKSLICLRNKFSIGCIELCPHLTSLKLQSKRISLLLSRGGYDIGSSFRISQRCSMDKDLKEFLDKKFEQMEERGAGVEKRLDRVDKRFGEMDGEIRALNERFVQVDRKFGDKTEEVIHRFQIITENLEDKIKQVAEGIINLNETFDRSFEEMKKDLNEK